MHILIRGTCNFYVYYTRTFIMTLYPSSYAFYTILYKIIHNKDSTTFFAKGYLVINIQQLETNNTNKLTEVFCVFAFLVLTILARAKYAALVSLTSLKSYVSSSCVPLIHAFTMLGVFLIRY